jgi:hypothetical protein
MSAQRQPLNSHATGAATIQNIVATAPEIALADVAGPLDNLDERIKADPSYLFSDALLEALRKQPPLERERTLAQPAFHKRRTTFRQLLKGPETAKEADGQGEALAFDEPEPWPHPVALADLLDDLSDFISAHVILPEGAADALAVWIVMTFVFQQFETIPQALAISPEPQCGKTTLLDVLRLLVAKPLLAMNISPPALFRTVAEHRPTLLLDEGDRLLPNNPELIGLINAGYERSGVAIRLVGDDHKSRQFRVFTPMVIAAIGEIAATIHSRAIEIPMKRATPEERSQRKRLDKAAKHKAHDLKRKLVKWAQEAPEELPECHEELPYRIGGDDDRRADNYRPLLTITEAAGGGWTERLIRAGQALNSGGKALGGIHNALLQSLRTIVQRDAYRDREFLSTTEIIDELVQMEEQPWGAMPKSHKEITPREFWFLSKRYGLASTQFRNSAGNNVQGLRVVDCQDAFKRYLDSSAEGAGDAGLAEAPSREKIKNFHAEPPLSHDEYMRRRRLMNEKREPFRKPEVRQ